MTGTFGGALEARGIPAGDKLLISEATGEVEKDGKVLVIKRIHVNYTLKADPAMQDKVEQVHGFHADFCPVARSIKGCIEISTSLNMVE
ncbi:MAG: OsmC family protein [bacterium]